MNADSPGVADEDQIVPEGPEGRCIMAGCVSRDRHWHYLFPGGYTNPADPEGMPIVFTRTPAPGVRDYNGALLPERLAAALAPEETPDERR